MLIRMLTAQLGQLHTVRRSTSLRRRLAVLLLTVLWLAPVLMAGAWVSIQPAHHRVPGQSRAAASDTDLWAQWEHVATTTDPSFTLPQSAASLAIDPAFAGYYAVHAGATLLGPALTPALPTSLGLVQFFTAGALLQPNAQAQALIKQPQQPQTQGKSTAHQPAIPQIFGATTQQVLRDSLYNSDDSVVQLAIFHALLSAGSTVPIGGDTGSLSYAALRSALQPSQLVTIPAESEIDPQSHIHTAQNVFITEGKKGTSSVGHTIPDSFWGYMTRSDIAPDGWDVDFGQPLTEAVPLTTLRDGQLHHLTAQAFWNAVLIADNDAPDAAGQPSVQVLDIGRAYLQTFGPPKLDIHASEQVWGTRDTAVLDTVTSTTAKIHVGQAFPFTLAGGTQWVNGALWYHVHWQTPRNNGDGWVSANTLTFTSPGAAPAWASFDVLSPDLASYLAAQGADNAAAVVYDVTHNQYYSYNPNGQFIMASSAKVPIMLTLLTQLEDQGRGPSDQEMYLLTTMIENSNNDSAQALFDEIGGAPAMDAFMHRVHVPGLAPNPDGWGWSTVSPLAMVQLLALLQQGKILNASDRALALNLMHNVESDQQVGVGDTAPQGASVALKDGWVPAPDGLWAMNSSGIVTVGGETYVIAVYTQHENLLDDGWTITRHVCDLVGKLLA